MNAEEEQVPQRVPLPLPEGVTKGWSASMKTENWTDHRAQLSSGKPAIWLKKWSNSKQEYLWHCEAKNSSRPFVEGSCHPWDVVTPCASPMAPTPATAPTIVSPVPPNGAPRQQSSNPAVPAWTSSSSESQNSQRRLQFSNVQVPAGTMQMGNNLLSGLENNHPWAFGAVAELAQNADDAGATKLDILYRKGKSHPDMLVFEDDGKGMSAAGMRFCFTLGDSREGRESDDKISGQYGVGFKQGILRLGHTALVISRSDEEESISFGILSNKPWKANKEAPICAYTSLDLDGEDREGKMTRDEVTCLIKRVLNVNNHFIFLELGKAIQRQSGTSIYVFGVEERSAEYSPAQLLEVRAEVEKPDILLWDVTKTGERKPYKRKESRTKWKRIDIPLESSLREYLKVLFLIPRMQIVLFGVKVESVCLLHEFPTQMKPIRQGDAAPTKSSPPILGKVGVHERSRAQGLFGIFCYTANCLIKSYDYDPTVISASDASMLAGVLMVLDLSKQNLRVLPNKQEYEEQANYPGLLDSVSGHMFDFARAKQTDTIAQDAASSHFKDSWIMCCSCEKWRLVDDKVAKDYEGDDKFWECKLDADIMAEAAEEGVAYLPCKVADDYEVLTKVGVSKRLKKKAKKMKAGETHLDIVPTASENPSQLAGVTNGASHTQGGLPKSMIIKSESFTFDGEGGLLGSGRFAKVFRGLHKGDEVAIKIFKDTVDEAEFKQSFLKEQVAAAHTCNRYDNIIKYCGFCPERKAIIMELVKDAMTLKQVLEKHDPPSTKTEHSNATLSILDRLEIMLKVAVGMSSVQAELIHRDLKPENVLCSEDLELVKIADFGICSIANKDRTTGNVLTNFQSVHYSAPEQDTAAKLTSRADVWSFGLMLLEICTCGSTISLWGDISPEQVRAKKKAYCETFQPSAPTKSLIDMLPCSESLFKGLGNLSSLLKVSDLVRDTLHPDPVWRPPFDKCRDRLEEAIDALSYEQCHNSNFVYHTLEPGDLWSRSKLHLGRKITKQNPPTRELLDHVRKGSRDFFSSRFISCTLDFEWAVHYHQVQELHDKRASFKGVLFKIDVTKVPGPRIDLSNRNFATKHLGSGDRFSQAVSSAVCAKEVVFDLGKAGSSKRYDKNIPAEAIVGVFDLDRASKPKKAALNYLTFLPSSKKITDFKEWWDMTRKDRTHGTGDHAFWTGLQDETLVTEETALKELRDKMADAHAEYWEKAPSDTDTGKKKKADGGPVGQSSAKRAKKN